MSCRCKSQCTCIQPIQPYNGMPAGLLGGAVSWRKSRFSNPSGNCVELGSLPGGGVAMRNSRDPEGPALIYTPAEFAAFISGAKAGEFDSAALG